MLLVSLVSGFPDASSPDHRLPWLGMVVVRLGCHGRDERLAFGAQLQALAPAMECFRRHSHKHLPLHRAEMAFSFLLKKSILEMRQKCERFQAFLGVSPIYLGVRVAVSDEEGDGKRKKRA